MKRSKLANGHQLFWRVMLILVISLSSTATAGWLPETRLTNAPHRSSLSSNNAQCFVTDESGVLHLVWYDSRDRDAEIYYRRFNGAGWDTEIPLTANRFASEAPAAAVDSYGILHVVWVDADREGELNIYHRSFDGFSWTAAAVIACCLNVPQSPSITADDLGRIHVVWRAYSCGWGIFYTMFDGTAWSGKIRLTYLSGSPMQASIASDDSNHLHMVWSDFRNTDWEIYYKRFDGSVWGPDTRLTISPGISENPSVTVGGDADIHLFWDDDRNGSFDIYHKVFDGDTWSADQLLVPAITEAKGPFATAGSEGHLHVVWYDRPEDNEEVFYLEYDGVSWGTVERMSNASGISANPKVALDAAGHPQVVWHDKRDGNFEIYWRPWAIPAEPELTSIAPDSGLIYSLVEITDLAGTGFYGLVKVWLQMVGETSIQASNEVVQSAGSITCDFDLWRAARGDWDVVVENLDLQRDTLSAAFRVNPLPPIEVTAIEPDEALAYQTIHITDLEGDSFSPEAEVWLEMAYSDDIDATNVLIQSPVRISCDFDLTGVSPGDWDVVVRNPESMGVLPGGFRVNPLPPVEVTAIEPDAALAYQAVHIANLEGDGFFPEVEVWLEMAYEDNIDAANILIQSPVRLSCDFDLTGASPGNWDVVVRNPESMGVLPDGFKILPSLWADDLRLTDDGEESSTSKSNARCIAIDGMGNLHVVWHDKRDGNKEIYYRKFDGNSWSADQRLTDADDHSAYPSIAIDGNNHLHVVWEDLRDGDFEIYYKKFDGSSWGTDQRLTNAAGDSRYPSVAVHGHSGLYVVWSDKRGGDGTRYIYLRQHDGASWLPAQAWSHTGPGAWVPAISVDSSDQAHIVWYSNYGQHTQVRYHRFDGISWSGAEVLAEGFRAYGPTIATDSSNRVHVAWHDERDAGNYEIYYRRFDGLSWEPEQRITNCDLYSYTSSIAVDNNDHIHLVWADKRDGNKEIYYGFSDGAGWTTDLRLTKAEGESQHPSLAVGEDGALHIIWRDYRDGNLEIYYKTRRPGDMSGTSNRLPGPDPLRQLRVVPNPVQVSAQIQFNLNLKTEPVLSIYDVMGRLVWRIEPGPMEPGPQGIAWDGTGSPGSRVSPGIYFVEVSTPDHTTSTKMIVLR